MMKYNKVSTSLTMFDSAGHQTQDKQLARQVLVSVSMESDFIADVNLYTDKAQSVTLATEIQALVNAAIEHGRLEQVRFANAAADGQRP